MEFCATIPADICSLYAGKSAGTFRVCGVFSSAVYLETIDKAILLLHDRKFGLLPFGFGVADIERILPVLNVKIEDAVYWDKARLRFPNGRTLCLEAVSLPEPERKEAPPLTESMIENAVELLRASGRGAVSELVTCPDAQSEEQMQDIFAKAAFLPLQSLSNGLKAHDAHEMRWAVNRLVGLGPGLTPSMDDFLVGALCTFHYASQYWGAALPETETLSQVILDTGRDVTGKYSWAYLRAAAKGQRFPIIEQVLDAFSPEAVRCLLAVGGHSGGDMMTGLLWAVGYIVKNVGK